MRTALCLMAAVAVLAATAGVGLAQPGQTGTAVGTNTVTTPAPATFAPLGMGLTVVGIGIGLGLIGFGAMGGVARQPEQTDNIRTLMLIIGGLVEGAGIISLVLCLVAR